MEPRDERLTSRPLLVASSQPALDFSSCLKQVSNEDSEFPIAESPMSSPQSESITKSPDTLQESASNSALSPSVDAEATSSPDVNHRRTSTGSSSRSMGGEREKRKRSRVTPDQLIHLERFFSMDRSPTAARRREISELLGMQERQTQIWFQNRRAKAKLLNGKGKGRTDSTPPTTPPDLFPSYDADLHSLIHESEHLTIGTWRRIATQVSKHDLVAYVCESRNCLTWFIHSSGYGFKMEIPFDTIAETEYVNAAPGSGQASFFLTQSPLFYLEDIATPPTGGPPVRTWKRCADWTEGMQATKVLRHDLLGSAVQLTYVLGKFQSAPSSDIRLRCPPYVRPELQSGHSSDQNPVSIPASLGLGLASEPHSYRPPFGGSAIDGVRDNLVTDVPKRYAFAEVPLPLSAPAEATAYGGDHHHLGTSSRSYHLALADSSSSTTPTAYPPYQQQSSASSSSGYSIAAMSLYPIDVSVQRPPQSHLGGGGGGYAQVSSGAGQSPYVVGQGHRYSIPASAPPSHSHFELAPTPPPPSLVPHQYQRHQTTQMSGQPVSVTLPFGNDYDNSGHPE
ncbi:hypothetical protein EDB92DRAFT_1943515 [Lactarius akahatsu]|uniref:Homeobox domain-containing protein n=1 Tax=Lactarius akahatsu TaxID=416441 RepID=A0AAD4Q9P0_9AGAM|nr:hypothetical protein EDB92DRAFT_1943515 [Lactarius akahatsu]